jgi:alkylation response protein AidB-like acyl-CoA dehydrogenase
MSAVATAAPAESAARHAAASDRDRRLPDELVRELADAGVYRLLVPASLGGLEAHPADLAAVVEDLARGDGAAGWCAAIGATSGVVAAYLPEDGAGEVFGGGRAIAGGVFAPRGRAVAAEGGGYTVSGRWPFASGCESCTWLMGGCVVEDGGSPRLLANGQPDVRLMLAPAADVAIHDTWTTMGLRGTGSHDIEFALLDVPERHSASLFSDRPLHDGPLYAFPVFGLLALAIGAVGLGIARGALGDIVELAGGKTPTGSRRRLADRAAVQEGVARAEAELRAARAFLHESIAAAWRTASATGEVPLDERGGLRLAATHAAETGAAVTAAAHRMGGGTAVYESSPLARRFRDAHVATQHMLVSPATWELAGRVLLGLPTDATQL